ncbi:MAG: ribosome small subunit-dependent GTPase A [Spirochaetota bacterium]
MKPSWNEIGRDPFIEDIRNKNTDGVLVARVVAQDGPLFEIVSSEGTGYARPSGRLDYLIELGTTHPPAVGDYVEVGSGGTPTIRSVLPRRSVYERKEAGVRTEAQVICANVDVALIVTTAPAEAVRNEADRSMLHDFNVRRVERFIATLDPAVRPVVVVNKCDLVAEPELVRRAIEAQLPAVEVRLISALDGAGVETVRALVPEGSTAVLVGSSGSGKSTLIGRLTGESVRTGAIRETDGRGRHTTTGRRMYALPGGGLLVDTPGVREVQLWSGADGAEQLGSAFPEIDALAARCKFNDCTHRSEPGCAVRQAVQDGTVSHERYLSYLGLHDEQDVIAARQEKRERLNERRSARRSRMKRRSRGS